MLNKIDFDKDYSKFKGSTELHNEFKKNFMMAVSYTFNDLMAIPYDVMVARAFSEPEKVVRCGQVGCLDILVLGKNLYIWFDTKTGNAVLSKEQKNFKGRIDEINGRPRAFKINSIREGLEILKNAIKA